MENGSPLSLGAEKQASLNSDSLSHGHDIIVIGASAGGVEALAALVTGLPSDLPAAVFVVLHVPPYGISVLPDILSRRGPLPARHPVQGEEYARGRIYIAPPDHHLLIEGDHIILSRGPSENGHRPAVDTLFRTAARARGSRVIGVVLSGALDDGTAGLLAIKSRGGLAVVQDPDDALFASMPRSAMEHAPVNRVAPLSDIAAILTELAYQPAPEETTTMSENLEIESEIAAMDMEAIETPRAGEPSGYTCPECHGALWEVREGEMWRYRCRVGHAYSPDSLLASQSSALEDALWIALRALEESASLAHRMADRARNRGHGRAAKQFQQQADDTHQRAGIVRTALTHEQVNAAAAPDTPTPPAPSALEKTAK